MQEPLSPTDARRLFQRILDTGEVSFTGHAYEEMEKDGLAETDCKNVIRSGVVEPAEWEKGAWRYRVRARQIYAVCQLRSETSLVVVTAWRVKQR
jgi:hypothetical protein